MMKIETERDGTGRLNVLKIKVGIKEVAQLSFVYGTDGYLKEIEFRGKKEHLPSVPEIIALINEKFIERIGTIKTVNTVDLITLISTIATINTINQVKTIDSITNIGQMNSKIAFDDFSGLTFASGENYPQALAKSGDFLYVGLALSPAAIVKADLLSFEETGILTLQSGEILCGALAVSAGYLYAGLRTSPAKVVKIDLSTFTRTGVLTLDSGENTCHSLTVSGSYLYAGLETAPGKVVKIDLATFTKIATLTFAAGEGYCYGLLASGSYLYAGTTGGLVVRIVLATFTRDATIDYSAEGVPSIHDFAVSGSFLYSANGSDYYRRIKKIDISNGTFETVGSLDVSDIFDTALYALKVVGGALYVAGATSTVKVGKVDLSTFTLAKTLSFSDMNYCYALDALGDYLYAAMRTAPGGLRKINLTAQDVIIPTVDKIGSVGEVKRSNSYLYAWSGSAWVPVRCDSDGYLLTKAG